MDDFHVSQHVLGKSDFLRAVLSLDRPEIRHAHANEPIVPKIACGAYLSGLVLVLLLVCGVNEDRLTVPFVDIVNEAKAPDRSSQDAEA